MSDNRLETEPAPLREPPPQEPAEPLWPFLTSEFASLIQRYAGTSDEFVAEVEAGVVPYECTLTGALAGYKFTMGIEKVS